MEHPVLLVSLKNGIGCMLAFRPHLCFISPLPPFELTNLEREDGVVVVLLSSCEILFVEDKMNKKFPLLWKYMCQKLLEAAERKARTDCV